MTNDGLPADMKPGYGVLNALLEDIDAKGDAEEAKSVSSRLARADGVREAQHGGPEANTRVRGGGGGT